MLLQNEAMIRRLVHEKVDLYNDVDRAAVPVMMALGRMQGDPFRRSSTKNTLLLENSIRAICNEPPLTMEAYRRRLASEVLYAQAPIRVLLLWPRMRLPRRCCRRSWTARPTRTSLLRIALASIDEIMQQQAVLPNVSGSAP